MNSLQAQAVVILVRGSRQTRGSRTAVIRSSDVEAITIIATQVCSISTTIMAMPTTTIRVAWRWRSSTSIQRNSKDIVKNSIKINKV